MSPVKLYYCPVGSSRGALLTARAVGIHFIETEFVDTFNKEHYKEFLSKISPHHCVPPILDDDGFFLWKSHAIAIYLADKYGKNDEWYSKDLKQRSLIHQELLYDTILNEKCAVNIIICWANAHYLPIPQRPILFDRQTEIHNTNKKELNVSLTSLDKRLSRSKWLVGDTPTIADTSFYGTLNGFLAIDWDMTPFPNIKRWVKDCKSYIPGVAESDEIAKVFGDLINNKLKK